MPSMRLTYQNTTVDLVAEASKKRKSQELGVEASSEGADLTEQEQQSSSITNSGSSYAQSRSTENDSAIDMYEERIAVSIDQSELVGLDNIARYRHVRAQVVSSMKTFEGNAGRKEFYFFSCTLACSGVGVFSFQRTDWRENFPDFYHMKCEWKAGNVNIISATPDYSDVLLRTMMMTTILDWDPEVDCLPMPGLYDMGLRLPDFEIKPRLIHRALGPTAVVFETHAGYMSPRQLRANLRVLFKRNPPQTAQYGLIVQMFPGDWSAAAVQWRRDEQHPEGFQLVAALDFGIVPLSAAAKALYALHQPTDTHTPTVPVDRWVRHAVVADNSIRTAIKTRHSLASHCRASGWELSGVWYIIEASLGRPVLHFPKADILQCPQEGSYAMDLGDLLARVMNVPPETSTSV